jgi:hypothetical protein
MSLSSTLNASQTLNGSLQKPNLKAEANFFAKLDSLGVDLKEVADRIHDLQEEATVMTALHRAFAKKKLALIDIWRRNQSRIVYD